MSSPHDPAGWPPTVFETASGERFDLAAPDSERVHLADIAHALSLTCRFGGHVNGFYSVAEHSVLVHDLLGAQGAPPSIRLAGLLHDAHEAYLGDMITPLKRRIRAEGTAYDDLAQELDVAIGARFGIDSALFKGRTVGIADAWALHIEARHLTKSGGRDWSLSPWVPWGGDLPDSVQWAGGADPETARKVFAELAIDLMDQVANHG